VITERSGDDFTNLVYRAAVETLPADRIQTGGTGPSTMCSFTALLDEGGLTLAQWRHLRECSFCARLAARINRSEVAAEAPPH
jgi:hypothetical protein